MAGGEASAIYEQFAHTPLKIRPPRRHDADASAATGAVEKGPTTTLVEDKSQLPDVSSVAVKLSFASPSGPSPPLSPTQKKVHKVQPPVLAEEPVVQQRRTGSSAVGRSDGELVKAKKTCAHEASATAIAAASKVDAVRDGNVRLSRKRKARSDSKTSEQDKESEPVTERTASDQKTKSKRITARSVLPKTSGITITIPAKKAAHSAKRRRTIVTKAKSTAGPKTNSKAKSIADPMINSVDDSVVPGELTPKETRSLLASFAHCISDGEKELSTPQKIPMSSKKGLARKSRNPATPKSARRSLRLQLSLSDAEIPVDYITDACDKLLETDTVSGALFSVALNSLRDLQEEFLQVSLLRCEFFSWCVRLTDNVALLICALCSVYRCKRVEQVAVRYQIHFNLYAACAWELLHVKSAQNHTTSQA